jgi:NAD(P)-dependent dehydrogenase (short-subunit alcohol dehydrogenase family)
MAEGFTDKVAIVTGGSGGIGRATALAFARRGAKVVVADIDVSGGEETVRMIEDEGGEAFFVETDVSQAQDVQEMVERTIETYGRLDFAFNNAGIEGERAPTADTSEENWNRVIDINLKGVWLCMKHEIPRMLEEGGGVIVNTSSVAGRVGFAQIPAYTASKHGVIGLTKAAALEYATENLRVNAVCPGVIDTEMVERYIGGDEDLREQLLSSQPMGRMGQPEEIADLVVCLCSEGTSFVTGVAMPADGGYIAQ